jgi:predicted PurR-regulated permease PerM
LTFLSIVAGVLPLIGSWIVWVPTVIVLLISGNTSQAVGLTIYGVLIVAWIDNILRPIIVSRRTSINPAIVLIGMIGGLFAFGFLGLILGPLILSYVILVTELYRQKQSESILIKEEPK